MKISIRKSKQQKTPMTDGQFLFAIECVTKYKLHGCVKYIINTGTYNGQKFGCDIYTTKTQISAVVYHG